MPELSEVKEYLRIDGEEDDALIGLLIKAAIEFLENAGVPEQDSALYKVAVMLYVTLQYENRDPGQKIEKFNTAFQSIILHLKN
ncbi:MULTISPECIES: head-tail connector protein [unclassified Bacillus (in: firmicutes)]|uniref:head-tail connector protein n=1 Tax=unclassified Bacillus (in: firmicutes) TaxID=185979 RepID=UPI001BE6D8F9|nr:MULTISPECIES: head-tail connector protein [unclassified Bacillus (in: firmicutes)]MBT2614129.1 phage gp6-like head-tail connector protein [Bacillus sp. ISL-78]MBT2629360.1 phage gp6-like head-tail connector protein [Bacillus sp. ISL-101]